MFILIAIAVLLCGPVVPVDIRAQDESVQDEWIIDIPPRILGMRVYGGRDETQPPIVILQNDNTRFTAPVGSGSVTIEFDVQTEVPPNLYVRFVHCDAFWEEDNNIFLSDITLRTSNITWTAGALHSRYFTYRGTLEVPNAQIRFKYSGNWKAKIYLLNDDSAPLAEIGFFVVDVRSDCDVFVSTDFYEPQAKVSPVGLAIEAQVIAEQGLFDNQLHTVVLYNNFRWSEPMIISQDQAATDFTNIYGRAKSQTSIFGVAGTVKRFQILGVPAENMYRRLDLTNRAQYPPTSEALSFPFADLPRNGSFLDFDNDGALITRSVTGSIDDYVNLEFTLDPEGYPSKYDVFIAGSFNNWTITPDWQMFYDADDRLYKLRHWVRRGLHDYMYATGKLNVDYGSVEAVNFEEFEGNTASAGHTIIALVYYRELGLGGYDTLIGVGAGSIFGATQR